MPANNEHDLLHEWKVNSEVPAAFNSAVWRRIQQLPPSPESALAEWFSGLLTRPAAALSYAALALVIGLAAGHLHASNHLRSAETDLMSRYIQTIDPYASPAVR